MKIQAKSVKDLREKKKAAEVLSNYVRAYASGFFLAAKGKSVDRKRFWLTREMKIKSIGWKYIILESDSYPEKLEPDYTGVFELNLYVE